MQTENFTIEKVRELYEAEPCINVGKKEVKWWRPVSQATKDYINQYFYPTNSGAYYIWDAENKDWDDPKIKSDVKTVYFDKMPTDVSTWFFKENTKLYQVVTEVNKPRVYGNKINLFYGFKHVYGKKYAEFPAETRTKVDLFLSYLLEVLVSGDKGQYDYILKWSANMIRGNKNDSCPYFKGIEGIGKSTFAEFLFYWVLGERVCIKPKQETLMTAYNRPLCGKLFVLFEELPTFTDNAWAGVSGTLKDMITSGEQWYRDLYEKAFKAYNINNYIINTNVEALKNSEGRRYFIPDISSKRAQDHKYFGNLKKQCFNNEVGEVFFALLMEIDLTGYNAQQDMPDTQNKLDAHAERLPLEFQFLKYDYIMKNRSIKTSYAELYQEYLDYVLALQTKKQPLSQFNFGKKLKEINIQWKKGTAGKAFFNVSYEDLKAIADKNKWIHELDYAMAGNSNESEESEESVEEPEEDPKDKKIRDLEAEIEKLKKLLQHKDDPYEHGIDHIDQEVVIVTTKKKEPIEKVIVLDGDEYDGSDDIMLAFD